MSEAGPAVAAATQPAHALLVEQPSRFAIRLTDLEADARVDAGALVEEVPEKSEPLPDARGPEPDRGWFAAGG